MLLREKSQFVSRASTKGENTAPYRLWNGAARKFSCSAAMVLGGLLGYFNRFRNSDYKGASKDIDF